MVVAVVVVVVVVVFVCFVFVVVAVVFHVAVFVVVVVFVCFVVVVVAVFVVVVVAVVFVVVVVVFVCFVFVVVAVVFHVAVGGVAASGREGDRVHSLREVEHRSAGRLDGFEGVLEPLLQQEAVGHDERGALHAGPILEGGLVSVRVAADRDDGLDLCQPSAGHVGDHIGPDSGRDQYRRRFRTRARCGLDGRRVPRACRCAERRCGKDGSHHRPAAPQRRLGDPDRTVLAIARRSHGYTPTVLGPNP